MVTLRGYVNVSDSRVRIDLLTLLNGELIIYRMCIWILPVNN